MDITEGKTSELMSENNQVEENKKVGFVKLFRSLTDWEWYTEPLTARLFIHLILKANWETKQWRGITVKRGQYVTSYEKLSLETGLKISEVRTSIDRLMKSKYIFKQSTNKYTLVTVVKYDDYQDNDKENRKQITNKSQTNNKQIATTKESKEDKEVKEKRESTPAFSILKNYHSHRLLKWEEYYKPQLKNYEYFIEDFNDRVEYKDISKQPDKLFGFLTRLAKGFIKNSDKYD